MAAFYPTSTYCPTSMTGYPTMMDKYAKFDFYSPMNTTGYYPGMPTTAPFSVPTTPVTPFTSPITTGTFGYPTSTFGSFPTNWAGSFPTSVFGSYPTTFGSFPNTWTGSFPMTSTFGSYPATFGASNTWSNTLSGDNKLYNIAFRPSSELEMYTLTNPIRMIDVEGNRQLYLCFELKGYKPEEVCVTLNKAERAVVVEAAHDVKEGKEHQITRKYSRKFVLPETLSKVDLTKVELKSCLTQEGYLVVECQLPKMTTEEIAKSPVMAELYNKMPFGYPTVGFPTSTGLSSAINNVKPVAVKTA